MALLAAALQFIDEPGYTALILRRTHTQLAKADSILQKSKEWLHGTAARYNGSEHKWTFPGGQTLEFGHMSHKDKMLDYQGAAYAFIGVDEVTQFMPDMISYPRTRQRRSAGCAVPMRWRGASNPGGPGHDYVKARYVRRADGSKPSGSNRQFFPATINDNPNIDREEYVQTLRESGIDPITLAQLLEGDWDAIAGGRFKASWVRHYHQEPGEAWYRFGDKLYTLEEITDRFLTVDVASTVKKTAKDDPDFTCVSAWGRTPCNYLVWMGCVFERMETPEIPALVYTQYQRHGAQRVFVEDNGVGKGPAQWCARHAGGMNVIPYTTVKEKLLNATNAMCMMEAGRIWLPSDDPAFPLSDVESQVFRFTGDPKKDGHDDIVDTLAKAANVVMGREPVKTAGASAGVGHKGTGMPAPPRMTPRGAGGVAYRRV